MLRETSGTGDTAELLVSTLLVVVALSLFLVNLGSAMISYNYRSEMAEMDGRARDFCLTVRSSPSLASTAPGSLDVDKLSRAEIFLLDNPPLEVGFHYYIIVEDTSSYYPRMDTVVLGSGEMDEWARHSASLPVVLDTGGWEKRTGMLTVIVWRL